MDFKLMNSNELANILLVDDSPADRLTVCRAIEDANVKCNLEMVSSGLLAMDYLLKKGGGANALTPDLILMDINMPVLDGIETLKKVRANELTKNIPVIMLTTSDSGDDIERSYTAGANAFVTKPVNEQDFISAIKSLDNFWFNLVRLPTQR
jgi:CheY-like chemotaxis protein